MGKRKTKRKVGNVELSTQLAREDAQGSAVTVHFVHMFAQHLFESPISSRRKAISVVLYIVLQIPHYPKVNI